MLFNAMKVDENVCRYTAAMNFLPSIRTWKLVVPFYKTHSTLDINIHGSRTGMVECNCCMVRHGEHGIRYARVPKDDPLADDG
jgi:hypothetical protein